MAKCMKCGKKSFLLDVAKDGKCWECSFESAKEKLTDKMSISKIVVQKSDNFPTKCVSVAIDDDNQKIAISGVNTTADESFFDFKIYNFMDIVSVDVVEDGNSAISGNVGSTIIGGILFGGIGAIAGAAKGKKIKKICKTLEIEMRFDSLNEPVRQLVYIDKTTKTDSFIYEKAMQNLKEVYDILNYVVIQNKKCSEHPLEKQISPMDDIRKYKALFDDGIITQEEFEMKKKQLLGI